jgi:hypothetical protein
MSPVSIEAVPIAACSLDQAEAPAAAAAMTVGVFVALVRYHALVRFAQ